jgi:hypothetical protein
MIETIKLSHTVCGETQSCEFTSDAIKLDESLWEWLQSAMVGVGFEADKVKVFFGKGEQ